MDSVYSFDWYDGPRSGIADYNGQPYFFESQWANLGSSGDDWFKLSPVSEEVFRLELERWSLWKRYEAAFHAEEVATEHHPFLPADRMRGEELKRLLEGCLKIDGYNHLIAEASFEPVTNQTQQEDNVEMIVCWKILAEAPCDSRKQDYDF